MSQLESRMHQLQQDYSATLGGQLEDYFGPAYMENRHLGLDAESALHRTARGNNDYGLDGYFFDSTTGNLYLYQFKYSTDWHQFQSSMKRLIKEGMTKVFSQTPLDVKENEILQRLRGDIDEFKRAIGKIYLRFVFIGNTKRADESDTLNDLREQLLQRRYLVHECFGREVDFRVEFHSIYDPPPAPPPPPLAKFSIDMGGDTLVEGPEEQVMHAGFISLEALLNMYKVMGSRFFHRNIRAPLDHPDGSKSKSVNKKVMECFRKIVLEQTQSPLEFSFMHNGVALYTPKMLGNHGQYEVIEPQILNGAQTVATVAQFSKQYAEDPRFKSNYKRFQNIRVFCKFVVNADDEFVRAVTVSTNRQNPVHPINLRANDPIQLEISEWLRENTFFYERQENSARWQNPEELAMLGIAADRVVVIKRLGEVFAVTDGKIERARNMNHLFDSDQQYAETFHEGRLTAGLGKVILCYKSRTYCHNTLAKELAVGKASFVDRAKLLLWALVCQGLLNHPKKEDLAEEFGNDLRGPDAFKECLLKIAMKHVKPTLLWLVQQAEFAEAYKGESYDFLRGDKAFQQCMRHLLEVYGWKQTRLGQPYKNLAKQNRKPALSIEDAA